MIKNDEEFEKLKWIIALKLQEALKSELSNMGHVDTGKLLSSIKGSVDGDTIVISMDEIGKWIEFGRLPGSMPPVEPLKEWAGRKLGDEDLGWAVAYKIKNEGIAPSPFIRKTLLNIDRII